MVESTVVGMWVVDAAGRTTVDGRRNPMRFDGRDAAAA
jgi:hypothetical protein